MARAVWNKANEAIADKLVWVPKDYDLVATGGIVLARALGFFVALRKETIASKENMKVILFI
jgi:hypothetical protein